MVSEICPVMASDPYAEIKLCHPTPSVHRRSKKDIKLFTQPSVKSPDELLCCRGGGVNLFFVPLAGSFIR